MDRFEKIILWCYIVSVLSVVFTFIIMEIRNNLYQESGASVEYCEEM